MNTELIQELKNQIEREKTAQYPNPGCSYEHGYNRATQQTIDALRERILELGGQP